MAKYGRPIEELLAQSGKYVEKVVVAPVSSKKKAPKKPRKKAK